MEEGVGVGTLVHVAQKIGDGLRRVVGEELDVEFAAHGVDLRDLAGDVGQREIIFQVDRRGRGAGGERLGGEGLRGRGRGRLPPQRERGDERDEDGETEKDGAADAGH